MMVVVGSLGRAGLLAAAACVMCAVDVHAQSVSGVCERTLEADWSCMDIAPVPAQAFAGTEDLAPLPGSTDEANPTTWVQVAGDPVSFDATTGARISSPSGSAAVFALTEGSYFCMLVESDGEAALFDAPEGSFVKSTDETGLPTSTYLSESIEALLGTETKLKYILYTHAHWDHMGAAGFVYNHFAQRDSVAPTVIASSRVRRSLNAKEKRSPTSDWYNNRGVPIPEKMSKSEYEHIMVGGLTLEVTKINAHMAGDVHVYLDKTVPGNAAQGITKSLIFVVDVVNPGWAPYWMAGITTDLPGYLDALDEVMTYDFDVMVPGHLTRLGTKADVQVYIDFFQHVLEGGKYGIAEAPASLSIAGTGVFTPGNVNSGNLWLLTNEIMESQGNACVDYVLDTAARGRDWLTELAGTELVLYSQCWAMQSAILTGG